MRLTQFTVCLFLGVGVLQAAVIESGYLKEAVYAKDYGSFSLTLAGGFHLEGYIAPLDYPGPLELVNPYENHLNTPYQETFEEPLISGYLKIDRFGLATGSLQCPYTTSRSEPCGLPSSGLFELINGSGSFSGRTFTFGAAPVANPEPSTFLLLALPVAALWKRRKLAAVIGR